MWNDYDAFRNVKIGSSGELVWSDQIDLCPDSLYLKITNQHQDELLNNREMARGQESLSKIEPLK